MRLIDGDALIEAHYDYCNKHHDETAVFYGWSMRLMKEAPSAQPERKKGKWLDAQYPFGKCDKCGAYMDIVNNEANYCCVCGAEMEGQDDRK